MALKIKLVKSLNGRGDKQIATAHSLGLHKIGNETTQPDNFLPHRALSRRPSARAAAAVPATARQPARVIRARMPVRAAV